MNEAEYLMKNYGDLGVSYRPRRITPSFQAHTNTNNNHKKKQVRKL